MAADEAQAAPATTAKSTASRRSVLPRIIIRYDVRPGGRPESEVLIGHADVLLEIGEGEQRPPALPVHGQQPADLIAGPIDREAEPLVLRFRPFRHELEAVR